MSAAHFWRNLRALVAQSTVVVDRPRGSRHPRHPWLRYPLDYGHLEGTTGGDGSGVDVWLGSLPDRGVTGIICTVDLGRRDAELKVLLGCTPEEAQQGLAVHSAGEQAGLLLEAD